MSSKGTALKRTRSVVSDYQVDGALAGPLSGPSDTTWRRQRLLGIGAERTEDTLGENSALHPDAAEHTTYGTLPPSSRAKKTTSRLSLRRGFQALQNITIPKSLASNPPSTAPVSPMSYGEHPSHFRPSRPISAYDRPAFVSESEPAETNRDMKTNGIRVWYSSFTSIDWLHDAIKDSARRARLRKHRSVRGKLRRQLDRSIGWIVVSIVGFFTAVVAFLIVRSEQWLFDIKDGYCSYAWYKAKRFCCPNAYDDLVQPSWLSFSDDETCTPWRTWSEVFLPVMKNGKWFMIEAEMVEYLSYTVIAVSTFMYGRTERKLNHKDSGVLSPAFADKIDESSPPEVKRKVMYYAAGSGIPEVKTILSGFVIHGYLGGRTLFTKSVGLALSVASGLSFFQKYENNEAKRREILSAACAAGVAVAFGAPIGGVLFSLEEVSYFFPAKVMWRSFFCAMVAAMTLKFLDPFGSGKLVLFQVTYDRDWHAYELGFFLLLGVFGGVWGAWFSKLNVRWTRHIRNGTWLKHHPVVEVLLVTLVTSILCFVNPYTRMGGTELVYNLFAECPPGRSQSGLCIVNPPKQAAGVIGAIAIALIIKAGLTIVTFGIKLPAGIFIPSLGVGACLGRIMGILVQWLQYSHPDSLIFRSCNGDLNCVIPGLYAMVGAAASLSGVTRTTVSLAVIMFELTDTLTYAVPVMLSVLVAKTVADTLEPKGIYDLVIEVAQLPYLDAKLNYAWGHLQISEVADRDVEAIKMEDHNTVKSLRDKLQALMLAGGEDSGFPILREDDAGPRLVGYIGASELEHALAIVADDANEPVKFHATMPYQQGRAMSASFSSTVDETESLLAHGGEIDPFDFSYYMDQAPLTVQSNSPLELVQQLFTKLGARYVIVHDTDGYYEGVIDKKTWLAFLGQLEEQQK
ncbi:hypothetical protein EIP86_008823 [Pleurotus ostreatoroseus]|nr:hypothetical protein EIP86_008823 [Pleurotus ostreatoroseus]